MLWSSQGGMTSMLQPLDVGLNRPMKQMLKPSGGSGWRMVPKPSQGEVMFAQLIYYMWKELDPDIIAKSFKRS